MTKDGYDAKKSELTNLQNERIEAVKELQVAREMGDLSENAAYKVARSKLSRVDARIRRLQGMLRFVIVVEKPNNGMAGVGSSIILITKDDRLEFTLVESFESDLNEGKISTYSPIGKAVAGRKKGDEVVVRLPRGEVKYKIVEIG